MSKTTLVVTPAAMKRFVGQLEHDPAALPVLLEVANRAKAVAEQIAPKGASGHYSRSFRVEVADGKVVLGNTDIAAHLIEWGSSKNPAYAPLRRAAGAVGARLTGD